MNLKELNDFQIGQVKGYLACKNNENLTEQLELEQNLETRSGMRWAYNKMLKEKFEDSKKAFVDAARSGNTKLRNILACRICDYHALTSADEGRYQITTDKDGNYRVQEVYSEDEIEEVKKRLDEDDSVEITEQAEDGSIWLAKKQDSNIDGFNAVVEDIDKEPVKRMQTEPYVNPLRFLFLVAPTDYEAFINSLKDSALNHNMEVSKLDSPLDIYIVKSNDNNLCCQIVIIDPSSRFESELFYNSNPWFVDFINDLAYQNTGRILTPNGVFDGTEFLNFNSVEEVYDSLGIKEMLKYNRY